MLENLMIGVTAMTAVVCGWLTVQLAWQRGIAERSADDRSAIESSSCLGCTRPICRQEEERSHNQRPL
jgi:hypothetical protein